MRASLALTLAFFPLASFAVVDTTSKTNPGSADTDWSWVGQMSGASAVAIGPNTVLTAAHVGAGDFWLNGKAYGLASSVVAPAIGGSAVDLRIVQLSSVLPGWYDLGSSVKKGNSITMVGYGASGVVNGIASGYAVGAQPGIRHAGDNAISDLKSVKGYGPTMSAMLDGAGDAALTGGDSGGGWFLKGKLVGISSFTFLTATKPDYGWAKSSYFGSSAIDLTNSSVSKWVKSQIPSLAANKKAALRVPSLTDLSDDDRPSRDTGLVHIRATPEPGSLLALGVGFAAFLRRRRR